MKKKEKSGEHVDAGKQKEKWQLVRPHLKMSSGATNVKHSS